MHISLTLFILLFLLFALFWQNKKVENYIFLSKDYTNTLKGICSIVIIFVHIPLHFQNPLQDAIGSFAYVAVTIFFLISAYGMLLNAETKKNYLRRYWQNRLVSLLIPCLLVNIVVFLYNIGVKGIIHFNSLWQINTYVKVLLEYCLLFYLIMLLKKHLKHMIFADILLIVGVVLSSLWLYLKSDNHAISSQLGWCYERYGLIWGILLFRFFPAWVKWLNDRRILKSICFFLISGVLGIAYLKFKTEWFWGEYLLKIILGFSIILFVFLLSQKRIFSNPVNKFLGDISYEIYLSHGFIINIFSYFFPTLNSGIFLVLVVAFTISFSAIYMLSGKELSNV